MAGKWHFNFRVSASTSRPIYSSAPSPRTPDRFSVLPLGGDNSLSHMASRAYGAAKALDGKIRAEVRHVRTFVSSVDARLQFADLPESVMSQFGFSPFTSEECPILQTPSVEAVGKLAATFAPGDAGAIYAGRVNLDKYERGQHFYMVAAKCGNVNTIAQAAGLPPDRVTARLGSMLGMLATWAGCMMAGGADIEPTPNALQELEDMDRGEPAPKQPVFGKGVLTQGRDMVQLQNPIREASEGAQVDSFLARTLYFHALVGTVLHMQYVAANRDITWFWVGGGGTGFISERINNVVAINLDIGIWPDMARSITAFYADPNVIRNFVGAKPTAIKELIPQLIASTAEKKPLFLRLAQNAQVDGGYPERAIGWVEHPENGVKGEK